MRVLIADDVMTSRFFLKNLLEHEGCRVTVTCNGREALEAARREPPQIIVSDVKMPEMDGFALCRAWMRDPVLKLIPFVFYSATHLDSEDEKTGLSLGAARYIIRPQDPKAFILALRNTFEKWTYMRY
jgi:CheY-like chemotaxis protein